MNLYIELLIFGHYTFSDLEFSFDSIFCTIFSCLPMFFFFFFNLLIWLHRVLFIYLFLYFYFWLCRVFVSVRGLSPVAASGGHSSSRCTGPFTIAASPVVEHRLQTHRLSSCGSRAQLLCGMWDPPRPGLEPMSPALAGRFSTTVPRGKPSANVFNLIFYCLENIQIYF